jgi:signal transduction histidine kinase
VTQLFNRLGWLPLGGLALVLISVLGLLYERSQGRDTSSYFENVVILRQLKQLDARWELDVMKSKMGIHANYDTLVDPLIDLNKLQDRLRVNLAGERHEAATSLAAADRSLGEAIQKKTRLIEHFKSHNSVLRNSLFFLPTAADDLSNAHSGRTNNAAMTIADAVLLDTMVYSQTRSSETVAAIEVQLGRLSKLGEGQPAGTKENLGIFASHVQTVLREQPLVDGLLRNMAGVPTTARIDELDRLLSGEQKTVEQQIQQDREYLSIFSAALVVLLLYAAVKLLRSHAIINRVNRQLHEANSGLERRVEERTHELLSANTALTATQAAIRNLLDNAEQGFLTVAEDLLVCEQSSAACEAIFGQVPAGLPIVDLLCRGASPDLVSNMRVTLESVFSGPSGYIRELKLELLPTAFALGGKSIKAGYKALADGRLMLILTDVTETMRLSEEVERERRRLEMIVLAFTESEAFSALVDDYREFLTSELPALLERIRTSGAPGDLYRHLHTYKGLLAQFSFYHSPPRLHDFETALSEDKVWTAETARTVFAPEALLAELERDLASLGGGQEFTGARRRFVLSQGQLQSMRQTAKETLAGERVLSPLLHQLLQTLAGLGGLDVKSALALHGRGASRLAVRLEKELAPIQIDGDATSLPPERYGDFLRSLVHVFRNAVDHGIEAPEVRAQAGKPIEGTVRCDVGRRGDRLEITIEDDGCGVNRAVLEDKLIASGVAPSQVKAMSLKDLVFWEGLSSRDAADQVSGRGIGLAAVKTELDRLGGSVTVENGRHSGARFCFQLPIESEDSGCTVLELMTA